MIAINSVFHSGVFGVDLFFVLSGFLITGTLLDARPAPGFFRSFYVRRFLRLFPVYYGFLVLLATIIPALHRIAGMQSTDYHGNWLWYIFYFSNYKPAYATDPYLGQFWSLAVEEQFYLTWPLTVYLLSRKQLAWFCCAVAFLSLLLRYWLDRTGWTVYALTFTRLDPLALGALSALAFRTPAWRELLERYASKLTWAAFGAFLVSVLANWRAVWNPLSTFFAAVWFATLVLYGATREGGALQEALMLQPLRNYGRYSYCIYVIHLLVIQHMMIWSRRIRDELHIPRLLAFILGVLAANAAVYWLASVSWRWYEAPILRLKDRFAASRISSSSAPSVA